MVTTNVIVLGLDFGLDMVVSNIRMNVLTFRSDEGLWLHQVFGNIRVRSVGALLICP